jgi:hypothetical protein
MNPEQAGLTLLVAEEHKILAHQPHRDGSARG